MKYLWFYVCDNEALQKLEKADFDDLYPVELIIALFKFTK